MGCNPIKSVTDMVGLTDYEGQEAAQELASSNAKFSQNLTTEQLAFQKEQYEDWKGIYGDLQENLGNYYKNLNPDDYISKGITAINKEFASAEKALTTQLAQRGISNSGIAIAALTNMYEQGASAKANIRATATETIAKDRMSFLGLGLGQGTQMLGINANVANAGAGNAAGLAGSALGTAQKYSAGNMNVMGDLAGAAANYFFPVPK